MKYIHRMKFPWYNRTTGTLWIKFIRFPLFVYNYKVRMCVIMQNDYQKQCHSERSEDGLLRTPSEKSRIHKVGVTEILRYALDDKMIGNFYYDTPSSCGEFDCICKLNSPTSFPPDFAFSRGSGEFLFLPTKIQNIYRFGNQLVIFLTPISRLSLI